MLSKKNRRNYGQSNGQNNGQKSNKRAKKHVSARDYFKMKNPQLFTKSIFSSGKLVSMSRQNLDKLRAKKDLSKSHHFLVSDFISKGILDVKKHRPIIDAMLQVDKKYYCDSGDLTCYVTSKEEPNYKIGKDTLYAYACLLLVDNLKPGSKVLDIGTNNGMLAVIMANLVNCRGDLAQKRGSVTSLEIKSEKAEKCLVNIKNDTINRDLLLEDNQDNFKIVEGNGRNGYPENLNKKLYDIIHVSASNVTKEAPPYLKYQLKEGGCMFIPINLDGKAGVRIYQRSKGKIKFITTDLILDESMMSSELEQ